jgi:hypothetical protein
MNLYIIVYATEKGGGTMNKTIINKKEKIEKQPYTSPSETIEKLEVFAGYIVNGQTMD